jgi:hypothetical protein
MVKKQKIVLSNNQQKIARAKILDKYRTLTARDIAEILWARDISYHTLQYSSVHRSLKSLCNTGFEKVSSRSLMYRRARK